MVTEWAASGYKRFSGPVKDVDSGKRIASAVRLNLRARWVTETTADENHGTGRKVGATVNHAERDKSDQNKE